jgi:hypothetical protein
MIRIDWLTETTGCRSAWRPARRCGAAVPGLLGHDRRVGDQLHAGAHDLVEVAGQHDRAVHLRQLAQPLRREVDVELEAAGGEPLDHLVVTQTISAPVLPRRIRSRPSRSAVPGATAASVDRSRSATSSVPLATLLLLAAGAASLGTQGAPALQRRVLERSGQDRA